MTEGEPLDIQKNYDAPFLIFKKVNDEGYAKELGMLLKETNIKYLLEETSEFVPIFSTGQLTREFTIKLRKEDFSKAESLLFEISRKQLEDVEKDYHLFSFTDEELMEIVAQPDEWNQFDFLLAQNILRERGKGINTETIDSLKKQRLKELAKPEENQKLWIYIGYIVAILGGLLSIFIGWHLLSYKKTLPDGNRVYGYSASDRKHGNKIFILGIISFIVWIACRLIYSPKD